MTADVDALPKQAGSVPIKLFWLKSKNVMLGYSSHSALGREPRKPTRVSSSAWTPPSSVEVAAAVVVSHSEQVTPVHEPPYPGVLTLWFG
jgi:hypothetical protein